MEDSKLFRFVNRANSIVFLVLLCTGLALTIYFAIQSNAWQDRRAVNIAEDPSDQDSPKVNLVLGRINEVTGHDSRYVLLSSKSEGKLSSSYYSGKTRNILFVSGDDFDTKWIFPDHKRLVNQVVPLRMERHKTELPVIAIYYQYLEEDFNSDGKLDDDDLSKVALSLPNGDKFTVLEKDIKSVVDYSVSKDGNSISLLLQKDNDVYLGEYDLQSFQLINSKVILSIDEKS